MKSLTASNPSLLVTSSTEIVSIPCIIRDFIFTVELILLNFHFSGENTEHMIETANLTPEAFEEVSVDEYLS